MCHCNRRLLYNGITAVKYWNGSETVNGNGRKFSNGRSLSLRCRFLNTVLTTAAHCGGDSTSVAVVTPLSLAADTFVLPGVETRRFSRLEYSAGSHYHTSAILAGRHKPFNIKLSKQCLSAAAGLQQCSVIIIMGLIILITEGIIAAKTNASMLTFFTNNECLWRHQELHC